MTETVTIENQVWESTLNRSMVLQAENERLKHDVGNLGYKIKNQRHEINNRLKEIENLKELLKECKRYIDIWGYTDTHGNLLLPQITQALGEKE